MYLQWLGRNQQETSSSCSVILQKVGMEIDDYLETIVQFINKCIIYSIVVVFYYFIIIIYYFTLMLQILIL